MMALLELDNVTRLHCRGARVRRVLDGVSLELHGGQLAVVWGLRRSGRSTLLRVAAQVEPPDGGCVRFLGRESSRGGAGALGAGIGFCQQQLHGSVARTALEHVMLAPLTRGMRLSRAREAAYGALARVGAGELAERPPRELDAAESLRVGLARALVLGPRALVVDEPVKGVELTARDELLALLRELADEGLAVLASTGEATGLSQADVALSLADGRLRAAIREPATVVPLRRAG